MKNKQKTKGVGPKIREESAQWYGRHFNSINTGVTWILEEFPFLYEVTLHELKGQFTKEELLVLLHSMPGRVYNNQYGMTGQYLKLTVTDKLNMATDLDKYKIDKEKFLDKLNDLYRWQLACLEIWASAYLEQSPQDPETWIQQLTDK